jgi:hypothetical protein
MHPIALILIVLSGVAFAQSPAERLEKGIYEQDTAGNTKTAIAIFSGIVDDTSSDAPTAAEAAYRLGQCQLQAGDANAAKKSFAWLIQNHPQQPQVLKILNHMQAPQPLQAQRRAEPEAKPASRVQQKLSRIIVPKVSFEEASVETVFKYLTQRSKELDVNGEGINFLLDAKETALAVTIDFENIPFGELIRYVCAAADLKYRVEEHAVFIGSTLPPAELETRFYPIGDQGLPVEEGQTVEAFFKDLGVAFPDGAKMTSLPNLNRLVITQTRAGFERIEAILREIVITPSQVRIDTELVLVDDPSPLKLDPVAFARHLQERNAAERSFSQPSLTTLNGSTCSSLCEVNGMNTEFSATPIVDADGYTIHLELSWKCEFAIENAAQINNFSIETAVMLWDGESIALLLPTTVNEANSKTGVLLVSATLINPAGQPLRDIGN